MKYYFFNPIGILLALCSLILATFIVGVKYDFSFKETIITGVGYFTWYLLTLLVSTFLPNIDLLGENRFLYVICSLIILAFGTEYAKNKFYKKATHSYSTPSVLYKYVAFL